MRFGIHEDFSILTYLLIYLKLEREFFSFLALHFSVVAFFFVLFVPSFDMEFTTVQIRIDDVLFSSSITF